jgi:hypothetical protein
VLYSFRLLEDLEQRNQSRCDRNHDAQLKILFYPFAPFPLHFGHAESYGCGKINDEDQGDQRVDQTVPEIDRHVPTVPGIDVVLPVESTVQHIGRILCPLVLLLQGCGQHPEDGVDLDDHDDGNQQSDQDIRDLHFLFIGFNHALFSAGCFDRCCHH